MPNAFCPLGRLRNVAVFIVLVASVVSLGSITGCDQPDTGGSGMIRDSMGVKLIDIADVAILIWSGLKNLS